MKWPPRNYVESNIPLITMYALIGHGVFHCPAGRPRLRFSIFYTIFSSISFPILLYYTVTYTSDTVEEAVFFFVCYFSTFVNTCTAASSWYYYKKRGRIVERISAIDETLRELDADCRYEHTFRWAVGVIASQVVIVFLLNTADMVWKTNDMTVLETMWFSIVAHHSFHVSSYGLLNFSMIVRQIGIRFTITNQILERITEQGRCSGCTATAVVRQKKSRVAQDNSIAFESAAPRDDCQRNLVQIIKQVHLELCGISRDLNETYGVQIVLQLAEYFALLTGLTYDLYLNYTITGQPMREIRIGVLFLWFVIRFGKVMIVNSMCAEAVYEANRMCEIIYKVNSVYDDPEFKDEISQFALQIMQNPLSFTPAGFFTLGKKFVRTMLGTVTTYVVILIQMNLVPRKDQ